MRASVPGHFRVWKDVYDSLEDEAKTRGVSLNSLVSQVLSIHARDDRLLEQVGYVKMPKGAYRLVLSMMSDEKLIEFGAAVHGAGPDALILARSGAITLDSILADMHIRSRGGWFSVSEVGRNGKRTITLMHDLGPRFSIVLGAGVTASCALIGVRPKITTTDSSVTAEF
jgi:hypothetical protein